MKTYNFDKHFHKEGNKFKLNDKFILLWLILFPDCQFIT
mgnify:CR=1 FL=1